MPVIDEVACEYLDDIYHTFDDKSTSGFGGHIAISGCRLSWKTGNHFFELAMVYSPRFAVVIDHIIVFIKNVWGHFNPQAQRTCAKIEAQLM